MNSNLSLQVYRAKRNFSITPEPPTGGVSFETLQFVIQKHWASNLHYDFRLELNGVMKSWAIPKGPSYDPAIKRMAIHVEDHPIAYSSFEGTIPAKQYGAGKVIIWDKGYWRPLGEPNADYASGNLKFELIGLKLHGQWVLVRIKNKDNAKQEPWLLIKEKDSLAKSTQEFSVVDDYPDSVNALPFPQYNLPVKNIAANLSKQLPQTEDILKKAIQADLPNQLKPQLATLAEKIPTDVARWLTEIKFDGYRLLIRIKQGEIAFFTRNGNDWTHKLVYLQHEVARLGWPSGWYDGEIVVINAQGIPDFSALQASFEGSTTFASNPITSEPISSKAITSKPISSKPKPTKSNAILANEIVLYLFDVVYFDGYDVRQIPLIERRAILKNLFADKEFVNIRLSHDFTESPHALLKSACKMGLEGIMLKRADAPYLSGRTGNCLKLKCTNRQEFIIIGYTQPSGLRAHFGALLLGVYNENAELIHVGNVGTGFTQATLAQVKQKLDSITVSVSPTTRPLDAPKNTTWVKAILIAEVEFVEWTTSGLIRHAVFKGLRMDKQPSTIVREYPQSEKTINAIVATTNSDFKNLKPTKIRSITHPDRIIDSVSGATKLDLIRYYQLVGDLMMPHLLQRPVSLLRAPAGLAGELFFQKHADNKNLTGIKKISQANNKPALIEITNKEAIAAFAQWNVIEFHTHNGNLNLNKPDRMVFDLDPGENVQWQQVQEAAQLMLAFLTQLHLPAFLKTSGGNGLHVVVPIQKKHDWETVKSFSKSIVMHISKTIPTRFVAISGPKNRIGKIFIDYLRNDNEATTVSAWSARARAGMGISVPVNWNELDKLKSSDHWTVANVHSRLNIGNTAWQNFADSAVDLSAAIDLLTT